MKKFKIICYLLILMTLVSCQKNEKFYLDIIEQGFESITFPQETRENLNFIYCVEVDSYVVNFEYLPSSDVVNLDGEINQVEEDEKVTITVKGMIQTESKTYQNEKKYEVLILKKNDDTKPDKTENERLLAKMQDQLKDANFDFSEKYNLEFKITISNGNYTLTNNSTIRMLQNPFYLETYTSARYNYDLTETRNIFKLENGRIVKYSSTNESFNVEREVLDKEIDEIMDNYKTEFDFNNSLFDMEKIFIRENDEYFEIEFKIKDILSQELLDYFDGLGIDPLLFEDIIFKANIYIGKDEIRMKLNYSYINKELEPSEIKYEFEVSFNNKDVTIYEYEFPYVVAQPEKISDITYDTALGEEFRIGLNDEQYFRLNLDKGFYGIEKGSTSYRFEYEILDENLQKVNKDTEFTSIYYDVLNYCFNIDKKGIYYLHLFDISTSKGDLIKIEKYNYDTIIDFEKGMRLTSTTGFIEGVFDFDHYIYQSKEVKGIVIVNNSNNYICVIGKFEINVYFNAILIAPNDYLCVTAEKGDNHLFIGFSLYQNLSSYEYNISVIEADNTYAVNDNIDKMPLLTNDYTDFMYVGDGAPAHYFKITITKAGNYTFKTSTLTNNSAFGERIYVYDEKNKKIENIFNYYDSYKLEAKTYYIKVYGDSFNEYFRLAYYFDDTIK